MVVRNKRVIKLVHRLLPPPKTRLALLPSGMFCNAELGKAERGQRVELHTAWRRDSVRLVRKTMLRTDSAAFSFLARHLCGKSARALVNQWRDEQILEGVRIDELESYLIEYEVD